MSVRQKILEILAEQAMLDVADVASSETLEDLGLDSLALVEIIFAVEETFAVQVPFNANEPESSEFDISSINSIVSGVEALIREQG